MGCLGRRESGLVLAESQWPHVDSLSPPGILLHRLPLLDQQSNLHLIPKKAVLKSAQVKLKYQHFLMVDLNTCSTLCN